MLDELNVLDVAGAAALPRPASDSTNVRRSLPQVDAFDMATASKAEVERALPAWQSELQGLVRDRVRRRDTTQGDTLAVNFLRLAGVSVAVGVAVVAAWVAYLSAGPIAGVVAGAVGLGVALAAASGMVILTRRLFDRSERERQETVARQDLAIRGLDERISQAFLHHGLVPHTRARLSF